MKKIYRYILIVTMLAVAMGLNALDTVVVGEVYDSATGEPLPNINIVLQKTGIGTTTNDEGIFLLRGDIDKPATMVVSGIGYRKQKFHIEPGQQAGIDIAMVEQTTQLQDVFVVPGTNPANELMARVRTARQNNDHTPESQSLNQKTYIAVSQISGKQLNRSLFGSLKKGILQASDSSYLLPLYTSIRDNGHTEKHTAILTETDYQILFSNLDETTNFYNNTINIYETSFLSPLASNGNTYYRYYLADSIEAASGKAYKVHFRTKNPCYPTFNGEMEIDSASLALKCIQATVPAASNVNYLRSLSIRQHIPLQQPDSSSFEESLSMILDFAIKADTSKTFPAVFISRRLTGNSLSASLPTPETYNELDSLMEAGIDSIVEMPLMRIARFAAYIIQNGCVPTGTFFDVGIVNDMFRMTPQEGFRLGIPLRTNAKFSDKVCLEAYAAYGFGDRAWKGMGQVSFRIPSPKRQILRVKYADEYVTTGLNYFDMSVRENAIWYKTLGFTPALTRNLYQRKDQYVNFNRFARLKEFRITAENEWTDCFETRTYCAIGQMGYGEPTSDYNAQKLYQFATLSGVARIGFDETKADLHFHRIHVYNRKPVLYIGAEIGSYQTENMASYNMYGKLNIMIRQHVGLNIMGQLDWRLQAGWIFGAVPYPLLEIFDGNQTLAYDFNRFTLMYNCQYAADKYVMLHTEWNGKGCLFNLIPGIKHLHLRELATFKIAYGGLSDKHSKILSLPQTWNAPTMPYIEIGCGIGNILRIMELHSVWRLTHRDDLSTPKWAIRVQFKLDS